jgi:transcriptional regulator with XRE-family HTH domain
MPNDTNEELGDFLRSRRERLTPTTVGLRANQRRRTPGLRREEVAALAGIGVDWYIRLEQGRCKSPSVATIDALAKALRLGPTEHAHLRALTRTAEHFRFERETVPETLQLVVAALPHPAYVTGRRWDVLAWNRAAEELFAFGKLAEEDRNILVHLLLNPSARTMLGSGWTELARRVVAQFRATHDLFADDPSFASLLARLRAGSPEFAGWWKGHDVRGAAAGTKRMRHPKKGFVDYAHASFQSNDDPRLRLVIYTPAPTRA